MPASAGVSRLIERLNEACGADCVDSLCTKIKDALCEEVVQNELELPPEFVQTSDACYARRLLHRCANGRYTIVVMVWDARQGTPIHDHAGKWCVDCVYKGRVKVTSYDLVEQDGDRARFKVEKQIMAGVGEAGALIPPFEYHVIENPHDERAVTIHVYGGEMDGCHVFDPVEGEVYERRWQELCYTNA